MSHLRPKINKERHLITFSTGIYINTTITNLLTCIFKSNSSFCSVFCFVLGFFFGCGISLIVALGLIIHARNIMGTPGQRTYMETMFPLYRSVKRPNINQTHYLCLCVIFLRYIHFICRFFGFVVLHMDVYAANIYFWRRYRVNYSFIFGFKQGTELGYRHVLLLSFGLGTLSLCAVLLNLDMEMDAQTKDYRLVTELIPLFLLVVSSFYLSLFLSTFYTTQSLFLVRLVSLHIAVSDYHCSLPL